jgi:hypothetical protein
MNDHDEIELLERELAASLGTPLGELRARRAHCPPISVLRASARDVLPAGQQSIRDEHLQTCAICRTLAADLQDEAVTAPTASETERIRSQIAAAQETRPARLRSWIWRPALGLAAAALIVWMVRPPGGTPPETPTRADLPVAPSIPAALRLEIPEVTLRASVVLPTRSGPDAQQYLKDLAPALDAYRSGRYAEAARQFSSLEQKYPDAIEVFFYGGVASLHNGAAASAVRSLERAKALNEAEFAADVQWYLGLAYHRAGNVDAARAQFVTLCAGRDSLSARACQAVKAMEGAR